jgi:hypothetical protein
LLVRKSRKMAVTSAFSAPSSISLTEDLDPSVLTNNRPVTCALSSNTAVTLSLSNSKRIYFNRLLYFMFKPWDNKARNLSVAVSEVRDFKRSHELASAVRYPTNWVWVVQLMQEFVRCLETAWECPVPLFSAPKKSYK